MTYLATDISHRLKRRKHPQELNAGRAMNILPLPLDREEQRVVLKMSA